MNPADTAARVSVEYMPASGENRVQEITVGARSRYTVDVKAFLGPDQDVSARVTSDKDVVVERPMYFNYHEMWDGGHTAVGHR